MHGLFIAVALLVLHAAPAISAPQAKPTFWVDAERFSREEAETLLATVARMVEKERLLPAAHREEADVIFVVRLGSFRDQGDAGGLAVNLPSTGGASDPDESAAPASASGSSRVANVDIRLVDVMDETVVSERSIRCRVPLFTGTRVSDAMLRAGLSSTADEAEDWAEGRAAGFVASGGGGVPGTRFGVSDADRNRLPPADLGKALRLEASRALRAGYEEAALTLLAEAQPMFKEAGERRLEGLAWEELSSLMASTGRPVDTARGYAEQAIRIAREVSNPASEARSLVTLAVLEAELGNHQRELEILSSTRQLASRSGDNRTLAAVLGNLAALTALRGSYERARALQESALELVAGGSSPHLEARLRLAMAVVQSHLDERDRAVTLRELEEVLRLARELDDRALEKDVRFVEASVRFGTTDYAGLKRGELAAVRAYRLSRELGDQRGEAASLALLGAFAHKLVRSSDAAEYLARGLELARANGYMDIATDALQYLGEMAPNAERAISIMDDVLEANRERNDLRAEVMTLSDQTRLLAGLGEIDESWARYRQSIEVLDRYVAERNADPYAGDVRGSFIKVLKSLVATRTDKPFLMSYLELRNTALVPHLAWIETQEAPE